ncbi:MAG: hypothetical protein RBQ77_02510 [Candidatus Methanomethylophilaceae archaeon]|jgi:hypothetical protein|nr:hypothetical protein [Candidatus Methanomethylophilaceae archaeon]
MVKASEKIFAVICVASLAALLAVALMPAPAEDDLLPPAAYYLLDTEADVSEPGGDPIEGAQVSGAGVFTVFLRCSDGLLGYGEFSLNVVAGPYSALLGADASMFMDVSTMAPASAEQIGTETVASAFGTAVCDVYSWTDDYTGDVFTLYVCGADKTVYRMDLTAERYLYDDEGQGVPAVVQVRSFLESRDLSVGRHSAPSPDVSAAVFDMSGVWRTAADAPEASPCTGTVKAEVLCAGSADRYGKGITYYVLHFRAVSESGAEAATDYLLGVYDDGTVQGGSMYAVDEADGRMAGFWYLGYGGSDAVDVGGGRAYDWMAKVRVAVDEGGGIRGISVDEAYRGYGLDARGQYSLEAESYFYTESAPFMA